MQMARTGRLNIYAQWSVIHRLSTLFAGLLEVSIHDARNGLILTMVLGDVLASAGDDGNVITWDLDSKSAKPTFGEDGIEDKESWRTKHMCRSSGAEIYDLAWSPDEIYFITGSMDNVARIYSAQTGTPHNVSILWLS